METAFAAAAAGPGAEPQVFVGRTQGRIVPSRGATAFGWDPVFQPEGFQETYAEMDKNVKNTISHRSALVIPGACSLDDENNMDTVAGLSASPALHGLQPALIHSALCLSATRTWRGGSCMCGPVEVLPLCRCSQSGGLMIACEHRYRALDKLRDYLLNFSAPE